MSLYKLIFGKESMTSDYIGSHGEFDRNDEDRAYCEDMQQMESCNPDTDLEEQFGWENKLNYDSEGYGELGDDF